MPCDDCSRAEGCPPCVNEPECWCGHPEERHTTSLPEEERGASCTCADAGDCFAPAGHYADCPAKEALEDESKAICGNCYTDHAQGFCEPIEAPPQPLRRPPYAVAYSVAGHLYEIALPGDATVQATDGGLIITHTLGPVAGVVRVHPIEGEQS